MSDTRPNHNLQKKIAVINDFSGFGRCSIAVALPIISAMRIQCCPLPTSIFSNHTGFESFFFEDYTSRMQPYIEEWKKLGVRNAADIRSLDQKHHQAASAAGQAKSQGGAAPSQPKSTNAFHNFDQRSYDYDNLESRLLDKNRR